MKNAGRIVVDREADDPRPMVVVNRTPVEASEWIPRGQASLSAQNPDYNADDRTVIVASARELAERHPQYAGKQYMAISQIDADWEAHPESRLRTVGALDGPVGERFGGEADEQLLDLRDRIRDCDIEAWIDRERVIAQKGSERYVVHDDGSVEGDGLLRSAVEDAVERTLAPAGGA